VAGLQGQACTLFHAARRLSVRHWPALFGGTSLAASAAASCPPHAEDVVAMGAFAIAGLLVPLLIAWLVEISYRRAFARRRGPAALARGPAALRWTPLLRYSAAETALVFGAVLVVSLLDLFADAYL
jgi:hypothetical protein